MKKTIALILAGTGLVGVTLSACSAPSSGYVKSIDYEQASSVWNPGQYYCSGSGTYRSCYMSVGHFSYYPESWSIQLCAKPINVNDGNSCGWREVDSYTYHNVRIGQHWPAKGAS